MSTVAILWNLSLLKEVIKVRGVDGYEISSFRRIGQFKPEIPRPRLILVKFSQEYSVDRILSRTTKLKDYNPIYNDQNYTVFISKSLNPEEQKHEQKLLKKRRETAGEKQLRIRIGVLYLKTNQSLWKSDYSKQILVKFKYSVTK